MAMSFPTPKPCSGADAVLVEAHDEWQVATAATPLRRLHGLLNRPEDPLRRWRSRP